MVLFIYTYFAVAGDADSEPDAGAVHGQPHHLEAARRGAKDGERGEEREGGVGEKHQVNGKEREGELNVVVERRKKKKTFE